MRRVIHVQKRDQFYDEGAIQETGSSAKEIATSSRGERNSRGTGRRDAEIKNNR